MLFFMYSLFLVLVIWYEMVRSKAILIDYLSLFHVFFCFRFLLVGAVYTLSIDLVKDGNFVALVPEAISSYWVFTAIALGYISVIAGYNYGREKKSSRYKIVTCTSCESRVFKRVLVYSGFAVAALFVYAHGHGGLVNLSLSGSEIRTQRQHGGVFQYFRYFADGITFSTLLLLSVYRHAKTKRHRNLGGQMFLVTLMFALVQALGTGGRGKIGMVFIVPVILIYNDDYRGITPKKLMIAIVGAIALWMLVVLGKSAIWSIGELRFGIHNFLMEYARHVDNYVAIAGSVSWTDRFIAFAAQQDHPITSIYLAIHNPEIYQAPRLFFDWLRAPLEIIPGISQPAFIVTGTPSGLNRDYFGMTGYMPPGWIAMKLINGGWSWLLVGSAIAGFAGGKLNNVFLRSWKETAVSPALYVYSALFWNHYIVGPDPFMTILTNLHLVLFLFIVADIVKIRTVRGTYRGGNRSWISRFSRKAQHPMQPELALMEAFHGEGLQP